MLTADAIFHFRIAVTMLSPWEYRAGGYSQENLDDFAWRSRKVWWNREAIEGIDPDSFPRLTPVQRVELRTRIEYFLHDIQNESTAQKQEASKQEVLKSRDALLGIFDIVGEQIYDQKVQNAAWIFAKEIRDPKYQGLFKAFDIKFDENWSGEPMIVIWLVVEDSTPDNPAFREVYSLFQEELLHRLPQKGIPDQFVSLRLRTVTEQEEIVLGERE